MAKPPFHVEDPRVDLALPPPPTSFFSAARPRSAYGHGCWSPLPRALQHPTAGSSDRCNPPLRTGGHPGICGRRDGELGCVLGCLLTSPHRRLPPPLRHIAIDGRRAPCSSPGEPRCRIVPPFSAHDTPTHPPESLFSTVHVARPLPGGPTKPDLPRACAAMQAW